MKKHTLALLITLLLVFAAPLAFQGTLAQDDPVTLELDDVRALAYGGDALAVADGNDIRLYDAGLNELRVLRGHTKPVRGLAWSPDGAQLASASLDGTLRLWDPATGQTTATLTGHADWVFAVAWSPDG